MKTVSVIGGAGRVGLPMCLVLAARGWTVHGVDINEAANRQIMAGELPFVEEGGEELLAGALQAGTLRMGSTLDPVAGSDVVVVVLGTPIDENQNPDMAPLTALLQQLGPRLQPGQLVVLRSTVLPGTTDRVRKLLPQHVHLVFAPERVAQGQGIREIVQLPQLIGAFDDVGYERAADFFRTFVESDLLRLSPLEVEIGKLITNMTRYVEFALSNEYYLICEAFGANIHRILDACNHKYSRLRLPTPGPNVGGPCLYKDGFFLLERFPFPEIISTAFKINESMPMQVLAGLERHPGVERVGVLGMTFKANSDDTRNSLSFKLKKQLEFRAYDAVLVDPHVPRYADDSRLQGCDAVVLMTPHKEFADLQALMARVDNPDCVYVDIWGFWPEMRGRSRNGFFTGREVRHEGPGDGQRGLADELDHSAPAAERP